MFFCEYWDIFKNTYFEEHLRTAASESFTWSFSYMNKYNIGSEEDVFPKIKQNKNRSKTQLYEKNLSFHNIVYHFIFLYFSILPYIIKDDTLESFETA